MIWPYTAAVDNALTAPADASIAPFVRPNRLTVRQRKNWTEIITSLDAKNQYEVYDEAGNPVFHVAEARSSFLARLFLRSARPFHSEVRDLTTGQPLLALDRPFRFIFHRLEVRTPDGRLLGALQKRWTWFRRKYTVEGPDGQELKILRQNMAFGAAGHGEFGTYFIGYARTPEVTERLLRNMFLGDPPGNHDRLLDFSTAVTGGLFFVPTDDFLDDPPAAPGAASSSSASDRTPSPSPTPPSPNPPSPGDGSLGIGSLVDP